MLNNEQRILNFEVKETGRLKDGFYFEIQNSLFNIQYSSGLLLAIDASRLNNLATMILAEMKNDC